jgi:hypothetical protein
LSVEGAEANDNLGASVGGAFDVNGDGVDDALVGAPFADGPSAPDDAGETYIISPVSPEEVVLLRLDRTGSTANLEWTVPNRAITYNVYRQTLVDLQAGGGVRTANMTTLVCGPDPVIEDVDMNGLPDTTDATVPAAGEGFGYLVTAENATGEGPLGTIGATPGRVNDGQCP